jgi:hypothetical protein
MATKKKAVPEKKAKKKLPRQDALPGMNDAKLSAIESLALDYVELRDERMEIGKREVEIKELLIAAMHKAGKSEYKRAGISVKLIVEEEGVKVRVKDEDEAAKTKDAKPKQKATDFPPPEPVQEPGLTTEQGQDSSEVQVH